jgi:D-beta-D-heptose 7-phosphate kinase/D-beta-D-heptose 1-phosphate adenosyltransferase
VKKVACVVSFNFVHEGHWKHIEEASKLGDKLYVIVVDDKSLMRQKGGHNFPLEDRIGIGYPVKWLNQNNEIVVAIDKENTVAETLRMIRPDIFAKGGDRTESRMPQKELDVCEEIGCEVIYGVGEQLNHSSRLKKLVLGI